MEPRVSDSNRAQIPGPGLNLSQVPPQVPPIAGNSVSLCLCSQSDPSVRILSNVSVAGRRELLGSGSGVRVSPAPVSHSKSGSYFLRMSQLPCSFLSICVQCLSSRVPRASNFPCLCIDSNFASAMARICCARQAILRASFGFHFSRMSQLACSFLTRPAPTPEE